MIRGKIERLVESKGFGFIKAGKDSYFFHRSAIKNMNWEDLVADFNGARESIPVTFEGEDTPKGLRAEEVNVIEP